MKINILLFILLFISKSITAQTLVFAELTGSPTVSTTGWNLTGATYSGDTGGDANAFSDEIILTNALNGSSGGIFYNESLDLSTCFQWKVEFDFRMWEGSAADGIAFCFLDVPPTGFVSGGGVGIPSASNGVFVILDTYDNGCGANPEIQIYQGTGYTECGTGIINRATGLNFLRSSNYQTCRIEYNSGLISVYVNNALYLSGNYNANLVGYMGFTASTGGSNDKHSIKNVRIYADIAEANAGQDLTICSGGTAQLGTASNAAYTYNWTGSNLSSTTISNPVVTLTNNSGSAITETYNLQTTLTASPASCPDNDQVIVTVNPIPLVPTSAAICNGQTYNFLGQNFSNPGTYTLMTTDAQGCQTNNQLTLTVNPNLTSTLNQSVCQGGSFPFNGQNYSTAGSFPVTLTSQLGCDSVVTLILTVNPAPTTQLNESICAGTSFAFGNQNLTQSGQYSQTLQTVNGCDSIINLNLIINPVLSSSQNISICQGETYSFFGQNLTSAGSYSQTLQTTYGCDSIVNLNLTLLPLPLAPVVNSNSPVKCPGDLATLTASSSPNAQYFWSGPENFSSQNASVSFAVQEENIGDYSVYVVVDGCISGITNSTVGIININEFEDYDFPNVITPNNDGINDSLDIAGHYKTCQEFSLQIFNRWGNLVFEQTLNSEMFSGSSSSSSELSDGVYFYKLAFDEKIKTGYIHIVR
jgi:gliding motility-associated-like protein